MKDTGITEAISQTVRLYLSKQSPQQPMTVGSFHERLIDLRRSLCTALQMTDQYVDDVEFAIENDLLTEFGQLQEWALQQLPSLLANLTAETLEDHLVKTDRIDHGKSYCQCGLNLL